MDLLLSLGLEDLPEQQTRTYELAEKFPDFNFELGFNACLACGKPNPSLPCEKCKRVKYCSEECRGRDSEPPLAEGEQSIGHSPVICSVLALCNDDEAIENGPYNNSLDEERRNMATDRVASEFESYPATLANIIMDGPCYQDALAKTAGTELTIHVIGASSDSELWVGHPDKLQEKKVFESYAEALAEIAQMHRLRAINLYFIGPECPAGLQTQVVKVPSLQAKQSQCLLNCTAICDTYTASNLGNRGLGLPDIAVFFNPGFTCPDYEWKETLVSIPNGLPYLVSTNTELEGLADCEFLFQSEYISELPVGLAAMLFGEDSGVRQDNDTFFSVNPCSGNRVRQSGTLGNDLYIKNRWILGGKFGKLQRPKSTETGSRKKARVFSSGNSKSENPALI